MKKCLLDPKKNCNECSECDRCDLHPDKICDNCCECLAVDQAYLQMPIADIVMQDENEYLDEFYKEDDGGEEL